MNLKVTTKNQSVEMLRNKLKIDYSSWLGLVIACLCLQGCCLKTPKHTYFEYMPYPNYTFSPSKATKTHPEMYMVCGSQKYPCLKPTDFRQAHNTGKPQKRSATK